MFTKQETLDQGVIPADVNEGWWVSVLSDECHDDATDSRNFLNTEDSSVSAIIDWPRAQNLFDADEIIQLQVYGWNRGGLLVRGDRIQGFVPVSHLVEISGTIPELERQDRLANYLGNTLQLKVIECEALHDRIVFSERAALAGEGRRRQLFNTLKSGDVVNGIVTNVTNFGVFVDLGGLEGLIHVSELSWGRVEHPSTIVQINQTVEAVVLQINIDTSRVALSLKRLQPNPWVVVADRYRPGDIVTGTITSTTRFGAFARIEEGVEGLIHISSISNLTGSKNVDGVLHTGQHVQVQILHIDIERRRLGLSLESIT